MKTQFKVFKKSRELVLKVITNLTLEQIHTIPLGFKNNIAWNVAHLVVTQQLLHYKLSGLNCLISDDLVKNYKKGTTPQKDFTQEEFENIKALLIRFPETLEKDFESGIFKNYIKYTTSTGFVLNTIETAISFNNFHEGMHLGIIRSIKKQI